MRHLQEGSHSHYSIYHLRFLLPCRRYLRFIHQMKVTGYFAEYQLHIADVTFAECSFAVRQVVVPHAHEAIVESKLAYLGEMFEKSAAPFVKGQSVVRTDVFHLKKLHSGGSSHRSLNLDDGSQFSSRKDVFLDPIALLTVLVKRLFLDGDRLQEHRAVRPQQAITCSEVVVVVLVTHCFEHFDAHDLVELSSQVTVVFEQQLGALPSPA